MTTDWYNDRVLLMNDKLQLPVYLFVLVFCVLCFVHFLFVIVWLSVPVQSTVWKDLSLKCPVMC